MSTGSQSQNVYAKRMLCTISVQHNFSSAPTFTNEVGADGCSSLSQVLSKVSSCLKGVFSSHCHRVLAPKGFSQ